MEEYIVILHSGNNNFVSYGYDENDFKEIVSERINELNSDYSEIISEIISVRDCSTIICTMII